MQFTFDEWTLSADKNSICFINVIFTEDFGPWKKGNEVEYLYLDFETNKLWSREYEDERITHMLNVKMKLEVI